MRPKEPKRAQKNLKLICGPEVFSDVGRVRALYIQSNPHRTSREFFSKLTWSYYCSRQNSYHAVLAPRDNILCKTITTSTSLCVTSKCQATAPNLTEVSLEPMFFGDKYLFLLGYTLLTSLRSLNLLYASLNCAEDRSIVHARFLEDILFVLSITTPSPAIPDDPDFDEGAGGPDHDGDCVVDPSVLCNNRGLGSQLGLLRPRAILSIWVTRSSLTPMQIE